MKKAITNRRILSTLFISLMLAVSMIIAIPANSSYAAGDDNLQAAKKAFGLSDSTKTVEVKSGSNIRSILDANAGSKPVIVHVASGTYSVGCTSKARYIIPKNVVFVAESGVVFNAKGNYKDADSMVTVNGALYGGTYNGNGIAVSVIKVLSDNAKVCKATVKKAYKNGITVQGVDGVQILSCSVTGNYENGISVERDGSCSLIANCTSSNNGTKRDGSGINLSHSNVSAIKSCRLNYNSDKGVSTNSDPVKGARQAGCTIGSITGCTIQGNKTNGVYIKPKCNLNNFTNNMLINNKDGIVAAGKTEAGTRGKSTIKNVKDNVFTGNKNSNIASQWSGATVYVKDGNDINGNNRSDNSIFIKDGGRVQIVGKNNKIYKAKGGGIYLTGKNSKLYIKGSANKVYSNKNFGIIAKKGTKGALISITGKGNQVTSNKNGGIGVYDKANLKISGKNTFIKKNSGFGIYAKGKGTKGTVKKSNVKFSPAKKAIYNAGGAKVKRVK